MSKICLYMDEDSTARSLAFALKSRGVNVITALEVNRLKYSEKIFNGGNNARYFTVDCH